MALGRSVAANTAPHKSQVAGREKGSMIIPVAPAIPWTPSRSAPVSRLPLQLTFCGHLPVPTPRYWQSTPRGRRRRQTTHERPRYSLHTVHLRQARVAWTLPDCTPLCSCELPRQTDDIAVATPGEYGSCRRSFASWSCYALLCW